MNFKNLATTLMMVFLSLNINAYEVKQTKFALAKTLANNKIILKQSDVNEYFALKATAVGAGLALSTGGGVLGTAVLGEFINLEPLMFASELVLLKIPAAFGLGYLTGEGASRLIMKIRNAEFAYEYDLLIERVRNISIELIQQKQRQSELDSTIKMSEVIYPVEYRKIETRLAELREEVNEKYDCEKEWRFSFGGTRQRLCERNYNITYEIQSALRQKLILSQMYSYKTIR